MEGHAVTENFNVVPHKFARNCRADCRAMPGVAFPAKEVRRIALFHYATKCAPPPLRDHAPHDRTPRLGAVAAVLPPCCRRRKAQASRSHTLGWQHAGGGKYARAKHSMREGCRRRFAVHY